MITYKQLMEKFTKGISIPHTVNPTGPEIIRLFDNSKHRSIKYISTPDDLFVWDANHGIHQQFAIIELLSLGVTGLQAKFTEKVIKGSFDPLGASDGTYQGAYSYMLQMYGTTRRHQVQALESMFKYIAKEIAAGAIDPPRGEYHSKRERAFYGS